MTMTYEEYKATKFAEVFPHSLPPLPEWRRGVDYRETGRTWAELAQDWPDIAAFAADPANLWEVGSAEGQKVEVNTSYVCLRIWCDRPLNWYLATVPSEGTPDHIIASYRRQLSGWSSGLAAHKAEKKKHGRVSGFVDW